MAEGAVTGGEDVPNGRSHLGELHPRVLYGDSSLETAWSTSLGGSIDGVPTEYLMFPAEVSWPRVDS
jgi:hypothetical protein